MKGRFIVVDGIDGCGKTTQIDRLSALLAGRGESVVKTKEPGGTEVGVELRKMLISTRYSLTSTSEMMLYCVDRMEHQSQLVIPALEQGKTVISDRFLPSTYAYQVFGRRLHKETLDHLTGLVVQRMPDLTIIIDIQPEVALKRAEARLKRDGKMDEEGKFEQLGLEFFRRVREGFLWYSENYSNTILVDGSGTVNDVFARISEAVTQ